MPGLNELEQQIKAAAAAGDMDAAKALVGQYRQGLKAHQQSMANIKADQAALSPVADTATGRFLESAGGSMVRGAKGILNLAGKYSPSGLVSRAVTGDAEFQVPEFAKDAALAEQDELDKPLQSTGAGLAGSIVGDIAITAPLGLAGAPAKAAASAPKLLKLGNLATRVGAMAGEGALAAHVVGDDAAEGAMWSMAIPAAGKVLGKAAKGLKRTEGAQRLLDAGVDLTPGQMNPQGVLNQAEQALESVPGLRQAIQPSREAAQESIMPMLVKKAAGLKSGTKELDEVMNEAVLSFDKRYGEFKGKKALRPGGQLIKGFQNAINDPDTLASDEVRKTAARYLSSQMSRVKGKGANLTTGDIMELRSTLRSKIRETNDDTLADILNKAEDALSDHIQRGLSPDDAAKLKAVDADYSQYKTWSKANHRAADRKGGPTLNQARQALKGEMSDSQWARGTKRADDRQFLQDATEAFETVSRPTGARLLTTAGSALTAIPAMAMAGSGTMRHWAQGTTKAQRAAMQASKDPVVQAMLKKLRDNRAVVGGALADDQ